ncbi:MAG: hypothetical protein ACH34X_17170 [Thiolinea sp.]|jgi:hypothetical protein
MSTDALNALTITEDYSAAPADPIKAAIARLSLDAGAVFETEVLAALAALDIWWTMRGIAKRSSALSAW